MRTWLALEDLFLLGLGMDIVGAVLLATSVTMSFRDINDVSGPRWGWSPPLLVSRAKDRLRGRTALVLLSVGFLSQAVGYLFTLGREVETDSGWRRVVGGVAVLIVGLVLGWAADRLVQLWRLKSAVIELSRYDINSNRLDLPAINKLHSLGNVLWPAQAEESVEDYVSRVYPNETVGPATDG